MDWWLKHNHLKQHTTMRFFWNNNTEDKHHTTNNQDYDSLPREKPLQCKVMSLSETGPVREHNEDSIMVFYPTDNYDTVVAMVADGMGGHNAGEVASRIACETVKGYFVNNTGIADASSAITQSIKKANEAIHSLAATNTEYDGMGTTAVLLTIANGRASFGHVGDSRLYIYRQDKMRQLTKDHTLVNQMLHNGEITEEQAYNHPMKNVITQALGTTTHIAPDMATEMTLTLGDRFLLCSDGVNDVLTNEELEQLLSIKHMPLALEAVKSLCTTRNTSDNFSVIIVDMVDDLMPANSITKEQNIMA